MTDPQPLSLPITKVLLDKTLSLILLVLTTPLWLIIISAILMEALFFPGTGVALRHIEIRVSAGKPFKLYKFRILKPEAEKAISRGATPKTVENQPDNLTRIGRILKKYGFDELPQFINILKGDMSFIGPRPKPAAEYRVEIERGAIYRARLRAGLSGPVQVMKGTIRTDAQQNEADRAYMELMKTGSRSEILAFDLRCLRQTVGVILRGTGE